MSPTGGAVGEAEGSTLGEAVVAMPCGSLGQWSAHGAPAAGFAQHRPALGRPRAVHGVGDLRWWLHRGGRLAPSGFHPVAPSGSGGSGAG